MIYFCCDERRRNEVRRPESPWNGIDFLEVSDDPARPEDERQRELMVHFVKPLGANSPTKDNVRIEGGDRIRNIVVVDVNPGATADVLVVKVDQPGDFSTYTLRLVSDPANPERLSTFDPMLRAIDFSFKVSCPSDFDCEQSAPCPTVPLTEPLIDYLAKDYASFRQLMLDRLATLLPNWNERNAADVGIMLVELLAYVGDQLSYQQDAIATEAYLGTARRRVSVRRHARLVDYFMHEGCNARVWVQVHLNPYLLGATGKVDLPQFTKLLTRVVGQPNRIIPGSLAFTRALAARPEVFETMHKATLFPEHETMFFYTWGARRCCLPQGATKATLRGNFRNLQRGDVLIFQEVLGPRTGEPQDADPDHRHAVRLTDVQHSSDPLGGRFDDPPSDDPVPVTEIEWDAADALPFPLCISEETDRREYVENVTMALGNIVLADHGLTIEHEPLGTVPNAVISRVSAESANRCQQRDIEPVPPRFRPRLAETPVTFAAPYDSEKPPTSASATMRWTPAQALPWIRLTDEKGIPWTPKRDLLNSNSDKTEFVVEVENDRVAFVRFGDDQHGQRPSSGTIFEANYRIGNGIQGNLGAGALAHIVSDDEAITGVRNPMPARGGVDPESIEQVRQNAPYAFRTQERAVTPADYAAIAERHPEVQRAAATFRWTGSWRTVFVTVDRRGGAPVNAMFKDDLRRHLEAYRMAGHDVEIDSPQFVALEIEMHVRVRSNYFRSDVKTALLDIFSNRRLPDGRLGLFHPDNFTFGETVYLSPLYAAAQAVDGVEAVDITKFQRRDDPGTTALDEGKLLLERLEVARLNNDPNFPDRGVFSLIMEGGK